MGCCFEAASFANDEDVNQSVEIKRGGDDREGDRVSHRTAKPDLRELAYVAPVPEGDTNGDDGCKDAGQESGDSACESDEDVDCRHGDDKGEGVGEENAGCVHLLVVCCRLHTSTVPLVQY